MQRSAYGRMSISRDAHYESWDRSGERNALVIFSPMQTQKKLRKYLLRYFFSDCRNVYVYLFSPIDVSLIGTSLIIIK